MTRNIMMSGTRVSVMMMMMVTRIELTNMKMTKCVSKTIINHPMSAADDQRDENDEQHEGGRDDNGGDYDEYAGKP